MVTDMSTDEVNESTEMKEIDDINMQQDDSDDDILEIEELKPNIESYEILDDEEEEDEIMRDPFSNMKSQLKDKQTEMDTSGNESEEIDSVTVKTEKIDLINLNLIGNPSHVTETISLDGNSEFSAPKMLVPKKIKINISSIIQKNTIEENSNDQHNNNISSSVSNNAMIEENTLTFNNIEPLPPGEELYPAHIKPRLVGKRLAEVSSVSKGKELSGLCSIM